MPIYEYECEQCGKTEEVWQKISDEPPAACSHCSGKLHKLMSMNSFHLKGGGWYVTDYANKSKSNAGTSAKKDESSGTKTDGAADTSAKSADNTP